MSFPKIATALAVSALAVAGTAQASGQKPADGAPNAAPAAGSALGGKLPESGLGGRLAGKPNGYVLVQTGNLTSSAGQQSHGSQPCPAGKVILGGGVFVAATSTLVNVNSSYPQGNTWVADVNNATGSATTFNVYAICGNAPRKYSVQTTALTSVPVGGQVTVNASCPSAKAPALSGGGFSDTFSTLANINSSIPVAGGWRVDANNGSGSASFIRGYAVCGKLRGYHVVIGDLAFNAAGTQTGATASCGTGYPVGGGAFTGSGSTAVAINTSYPVNGGWKTYMNNGSDQGAFFRTYVVCAGS
jgi:hypothetical protein